VADNESKNLPEKVSKLVENVTKVTLQKVLEEGLWE
jgi:hypothetical protein